MKYALLIYAVPGAADGVQPADDGVIDSWIDYTAATKQADVLLGAERLAHVDTATSVTLQGGQRLLTDELARRSPSPVVEVNRAVAVGIADGPLAGLALLAPVLASGELDGYAPLHSAHADLLDRAGRAAQATAAWARAIETMENGALREALERRVAARDQPEPPDS
jgi:hypothetical protein